MEAILTTDAEIDAAFGEVRSNIRAAALSAVTEIGGLIADELIQRLNTPYPPASDDSGSDDPHRRTGQLSAGIAHNVYELPDGVTTVVTSSREGGDEMVPSYLNEGTSRMAPRPYMTKTFEDWEQRFQGEAERLFWEAFN